MKFVAFLLYFFPFYSLIKAHQLIKFRFKDFNDHHSSDDRYSNHVDGHQFNNFHLSQNDMTSLLNHNLNSNSGQKLNDNTSNSVRYPKRLAAKKLQTPNFCKCEIKRMAKIVNGQNADTKIPWQVSLSEHGSHFCAGSIINNYFILTAAHCIWDSKAPHVQVRVGINHLNDPTISRKTYQVDRIYVHPQYNDQTDASAPGDVGLLRLKTPIQFIEGVVEPACLGLKSKRYSRVLATGWGSTLPTTGGLRQFPGKLSNVLKKAEFGIRSPCESNQLICIKSLRRGQSICDGDSGGPLHFTSRTSSNGRNISSVVGVCSFGLGKPIGGGVIKYCIGQGAYTRLSSYKGFITSKLGNSGYCPG